MNIARFTIIFAVVILTGCPNGASNNATNRQDNKETKQPNESINREGNALVGRLSVGMSPSFNTADFDAGVAVPPVLMGYDSIRGTPTGTICVRETAAKPAKNTGQQVEFTLDHVTKTEDLASSLNLNASASMGFGTGRVQATYNYFQSAKSSQYDESLVVRVFVQNQAEYSATVALIPAMERLRAKNPWKFYEQCGDSYVSVHITGGEYMAIARFTSASTEEQRKVSASLDASAGRFESKAQLDQASNKVTGLKDYKANVLMKGPAAKIETEMPQIMETAKNFPSTVSGDKGYVVRILTASYPISDTLLPLEKAVALENLSRTQASALRRIAGIDHIRNHSAQFPTITKDELDREETNTRAVVAQIRSLAQACISDKSRDFPSCRFNYPSVPALPLRAEDWTEFKDEDVRSPHHRLRQTGADETLYFEMTGEWAQAPGAPWQNTGSNMIVSFIPVDSPSKLDQRVLPPGSRYLVKPNTTVQLFIQDWPGMYGDNLVNPNNKARYRFVDAHPLGQIVGPTPNQGNSPNVIHAM